MKITYYSHVAVGLEHDGTRLIIDPFLTGNGNAPVKADEIDVSYVLLTHAHGDHIGDGVSIAKRNNATVIAPFELATICENEGCNVHPMHIGGAHAFDFGRVKLTIAHHGSGYMGNGNPVYGGNPCGFLITMGGRTVYHAGDTGLFLDMKLIGEMNEIDVAFLPIGDNFTMGITDAVKATEFIKPGIAIPTHYNTFPVIEADPGEFVRQVEATGMKARALDFGETIEI